MNDNIKRYDLHKDDYSKLHFEVNDGKTYFEKNKTHAAVPHRHSFYQIIWFKEKGRHYVDYEVVEHEANSLFFINKQSKEMMNRFSTTIFNEIGKNHMTLSKTEIKNIGLLTSFIQSEILTKEASYKEQVYHYFQNILLLIERSRAKERTISTKTNEDYKLASDFKKLVMAQIEDFHNIDEYASKLGTNSKTLTEVSKEYLFNTPANVIKESKLLEAKRMMSNQKISIKEIAYALGFDDPTYFTKYFKKGTGMTPKEFQKLHF